MTLLEEGSLGAVEERLDEEQFTVAFTQLSQLPCIVSNFGQQFVKPRQVVIDICESDQICPYLHKVRSQNKRLNPCDLNK